MDIRDERIMMYVISVYRVLLSEVFQYRLVRCVGVIVIENSRLDMVIFVMKKFIGFFRFSVLYISIFISEFLMSEIMKIKKEVIVDDVLVVIMLNGQFYLFFVEYMFRSFIVVLMVE